MENPIITPTSSQALLQQQQQQNLITKNSTKHQNTTNSQLQQQQLHNNGGGGHPYASSGRGAYHHRAYHTDNSQMNVPFAMNGNNAQRMELPLRVLVPTSTMGAIIGKGGVTIKQIIADTLTRVDVHRNHGPVPQEKIISIYGSAANCSRALQKIMEIVRNELRSSEKPEPDVPLRMLAHNAHVGRVIGKNGATINSIMKNTDTRIAVSSSSWDYSQFLTERVITIQGQLADQVRAEQQISSILRQFYAKDLMGAMCANNYVATTGVVSNNLAAQSPAVVNGTTNTSLGGRSSNDYSTTGSGSMSITSAHHYGHASQDHTNLRGIQNGNGQIYATPLPMGYVDPMHTNAAYLQPSYGHMNHLASTHNIAALQMMGPQVVHALGGLSMAAMRISSLEKKKELAIIHVPAQAVGPIIGTGGSTIRDMVHASGAVIKVTSPATKEIRDPTIIPTKTISSENSNESGSTLIANNSISSETNQQRSDENNQQSTQENSSDNETSTTAQNESNELDDTLTKGVSSDQQLTDSLNKVDLNVDEMRKVTIFGVPEAQWRAQYMIFRKASGNQTDGMFKVEIHIPTAQAGRIIGRNGSTVKELQLFTNARIKIGDNDQPTGDETPVYITGDFFSTQTAQRQIRALVAKSLQDSSRTKQNQTNSNNNMAQNSTAASNDVETKDKNSSNIEQSLNEAEEHSEPSEKLTN